MTQPRAPDFYDAIVMGAGFGGLQMMHDLLTAGKTVKTFEAGSDVGGTWYWNRYPGARTDSESWGYCFAFSQELRDEWTWSERLAAQPDVLNYLQHVADRFDLRRHISFNSRVASAHWDEKAQEWIVTTEQGVQARGKFLVSATGVLSVPKTPEFPGLDKFKGELYFAPRWPKHPVSFEGKRVAIIGAAATAVQLLPIIAKTASHVYYLQRTPNYVLPARNYSIHEEETRGLKAMAPEMINRCRQHAFGLPMISPGRCYDSVSDAERQRIFDAGWEEGGFHFCFETFDDILTDRRSNDAASEFVRNKIRTIVRDPATAEALCPRYPLFAKRPPSGHFYYEAFNRENVTLVDIKDDPIREVTETGVATGLQSIDVDMIILATGFDAATGPLNAIDVRGRDGVKLRSQWSNGPHTEMGLMVDRFPNLFMIMGPQSPFGNIPPIIHGQVEWISEVIRQVDARGGGTVEPSTEATAAWTARAEEIYRMTVLPAGVEARTWFLGANVPGKPVSVLFFFGGVGTYLSHIRDVAHDGLPGFQFEPPWNESPRVAEPA